MIRTIAVGNEPHRSRLRSVAGVNEAPPQGKKGRFSEVARADNNEDPSDSRQDSGISG